MKGEIKMISKLYIRAKLVRCAQFVNAYNEQFIFDENKLSFYKMTISGDVIDLPDGITMSDMALYFEVISNEELMKYFFTNAESILIDFMAMTYKPLPFNHTKDTFGPEVVFSIVELARLYNCKIDYDEVISQLEKHSFVKAN